MASQMNSYAGSIGNYGSVYAPSVGYASVYAPSVGYGSHAGVRPVLSSLLLAFSCACRLCIICAPSRRHRCSARAACAAGPTALSAVQSVAAGSVYGNSFMGAQPDHAAAAGGGAFAGEPIPEEPPAAPLLPPAAAAPDFSFPQTAGDADDGMSAPLSPNVAGTPLSGTMSPGGHSGLTGGTTGMTGLLQGAQDLLGEMDQTTTLASGMSQHGVSPRSPAPRSPNP